MKFKIITRKSNTFSTVNYILKLAVPGSTRSTIPQFSGTSNFQFAKLVDKKFEDFRASNQDRLYFHKIIGFHPSDSNKSDAELMDIAEEALKISMPGKRHFVMSVERNTAHPHVHICVALRSIETKKVHRDFVDYIKIGVELEIKHGLYNADRDTKPHPAAPAPGTMKIEARTGSKPLKNYMKESIAYSFEKAKKTSEFLELLKQSNIKLLPNLNSAGVSGLSFEKDGEVFKGSQLNYPIKKIKDKFGGDPLFTTLMQLTAEENQRLLEEQDLIGLGQKSSILRKYSNRTIDKHFLSSDEKNYYFKNTNKIAFVYDSEKNEAKLKTSNFKTIKAAAQKILETGTAVTTLPNSSDDFKKQTWLVCTLNNFPMSDFYKPSPFDLQQAIKMTKDENLKLRLERELKELEVKKTVKPESKKTKFRVDMLL
ncbi:relaxase/mobilization nuclease family protein [Pseudomonas sp. CFII64]|uniref:relaxase/mobilization nuclease domain-containing protein n=1 Tax=Pseudomonas sp. CFII64 TaxID=911242 RepID=UPI00035730FE|nr:relaxase/mobilization nuclease domain-containing protein [Pseudomonas sp. CFII64]EPJ77218.1 relaxase/mobilization nuclease family protein [Pseudomonas sp. CFII64]